MDILIANCFESKHIKFQDILLKSVFKETLCWCLFNNALNRFTVNTIPVILKTKRHFQGTTCHLACNYMCFSLAYLGASDLKVPGFYRYDIKIKQQTV